MLSENNRNLRSILFKREFPNPILSKWPLGLDVKFLDKWIIYEHVDLAWISLNEKY